MGIYAVTGGTKGIGEKTVEILRTKGHEVINIDLAGGDIHADLGTVEGRDFAVSQVYKHCPDGLDGLVCNHGIGGLPSHKYSYILSVNYFGAVAIMEGLYELLKKRKGSCTATVSGSIHDARCGRYYVDGLLNNCGDEVRIGRLVDNAKPGEAVNMPYIMYVSAKIALARWVRRASSSWAAHGVNLNAIAPGGVATTIMQDFIPPDAETYSYPMPALFNQNRLMAPVEVAQVLAFLTLPEAKGVNGIIMYCDAGNSAVMAPDRY